MLYISSQDELRELKQKVAHKIDFGNRFVNLDMIPREDTGEVINPKSSGVMKLFKAVSQAQTITYRTCMYYVCMLIDSSNFTAHSDTPSDHF